MLATRRALVGAAVAIAIGSAALLLASCGGTANGEPAAGGKLHVVAAENFWGNIAAQLGGDRVAVTSIISSPDTDPHEFEARPSDARAVASAQYFIYNGIGYDPWAGKLVDANPATGRVALKVQDLLGLKSDANPHRWYSPPDVLKVVDQITADYQKLDPSDSAFFAQLHRDFLANALKDYTALVQQIRQDYAGTPVGATESIVSPMVDALGLKMLTPYAFLQAISEGTDPTAQDKAVADQQIASGQIAVLLVNTQNATPDAQRLVEAAKAKGIPIVDVTETLEPSTGTFQAWQTAQLQSLADALARRAPK
ncbi:MAG: metal ABC transporter solute-binding protein, Zn/Mn family [Tepidiformaceae bacterium]